MGAGKHEIEFEYRPWPVTVGAGLTIVGTLIALAAAAVRLKKA